jgi:hypothetical protein
VEYRVEAAMVRARISAYAVNSSGSFTAKAGTGANS